MATLTHVDHIILPFVTSVHRTGSQPSRPPAHYSRNVLKRHQKQPFVLRLCCVAVVRPYELEVVQEVAGL